MTIGERFGEAGLRRRSTLHGRPGTRSPDEVSFVNPGNKLSSCALSTAKTMADEAQERIEHSSAIRAESECAPDGNLTCERSRLREEGLFPSFRNSNEKFQVSGAPGSLPLVSCLK